MSSKTELWRYFVILLPELAVSKNLINSVGVAFASLDAFLVWRYLTEINFADKEAYLRGEGLLTVPYPTQDDIKRLRRSINLSKLGLEMFFSVGHFKLCNHISS